MKCFALVSLFLISYSTTFSQESNYQSAKIVLTSGDTLVGFVENASLNKIYNQIKFKKTTTGDYTAINAKEVLRVSLSNNYVFESLMVKYDPESQKTRSLPSQKEPQAWKEERMFLEVVTEGNLVSLLMFEDREGRIHFFIKEKESVTELLRRSFLGEENEIRTNKKYIGQLRSIFLDCPEAIINDKLKYDRESLVTVFNKYFICKGGEPVQADKDKAVVAVGFVADFFYEFRKFEDIKNGVYGIQQFSSVGISPGISLEVRSKKPYKKFSFYQELHYKSLNNEDIPFKESSLELLILPRLNYTLKSGAIIYWNSGVTFSYIFNRETGDYGITHSGALGNLAIVTGFGWRAVRSEKIDLSLECRGKLGGVFGHYDPKAGIGLVISIVPKL